MSDILKGKVAIVTGSSRGIGKAIAIEFAKAGAAIVVAARTETQKGDLPGTISETVDEIRAVGGKAICIRCDHTVEEDVDRMVKETVEEFGGVDILVNNAAVGYYVPLLETPAKHWDLIMRVNTKGPFLCSLRVIPEMKKRGAGSIVNLSSPAATDVYSRVKREGEPPRLVGSAYGASKAAIERFSRGLAAELAPHNIAVNAIKPTEATYSEGLVFQNRDADPNLWIPADRYMTKAVLFLASQDAKGVTGAVYEDQILCREFNLA